MKPLNFNKNSWHFRLVTKMKLYEAPYQKDIWGDGSEVYTLGDSADICTYSKRVALAIFWVAIGVAFLTLISMMMIDVLLGVYFSIMMGQWFFSELGLTGLFTLSALLMFVVIFQSFQALDRWKEKNYYYNKSHKSDTFFSNAYKSWKNKFCVPIKFIE